MPVHSTQAAMSVNGWITLDTSNVTPASQQYYFESYDFKSNLASSNSVTQNFYIKNNNVFVYGQDNAKPYVISFNASGNIIFNKSTSGASTTLNPISMAIDNNGSTHVLVRGNGNNLDLMKFDITGAQVLYRRFSLSPSFGTGKSLIVDNSNNLYFLISSASTFALTKIDPTSYTVTWCKGTSPGLNVGTVNKLQVDESNNIYVMLDDYIYKFDSSGNVIWAKNIGGSVYSLASVSSIDSGGNVLILSGIDYLKLDSSTGNKIFEKTTNINFSNGNICSSTLTPNGDILGLTTTGSLGNNFKVVSFTTSNTPAFIANILYTDNTVRTGTWVTNSIECTNTNSVITFKMNDDSGVRYTMSTMKLPASGNLQSISTNYNFNVTVDNGNVYTYSGNLTSSIGTNVSLANSANWTVANANTTFSNSTVTLTAQTGNYSVVTPTEYILPLP